jgi:hypothetical protein
MDVCWLCVCVLLAGHTVSAVPVFAASGINSLHIGANSACVAPAVPPAFIWRHEETATELLTMLYNLPSPSTPCTWTPYCYYGGDVVLPNVSIALVYQFTSDNSNPATPDAVIDLWVREYTAHTCLHLPMD